jgi:hypothetical protein
MSQVNKPSSEFTKELSALVDEIEGAEKLEFNKPLGISSSIGAGTTPVEDRDFFCINPDCKKLIAEGKCNADCCGNASMLLQYFKVLKKHISPDKEYKTHTFKSGSDVYVKAITPDFKCVFLDENLSCKIHSSHFRPEICKNFGCNATEPLLACTHINEDKKEIIQEFIKTYLQALSANGNPLAKAQVLDKSE